MTSRLKPIRREDGLWNYIEPDGTILCKEWYCDAGPFSEGLGIVERGDGKLNYVKSDGTLLLTLK